MDLPEGLYSGMGGSGALNGVCSVFCTTCRATVVFLAYEKPRFVKYPELRDFLIAFARRIGVPALLEREETQEIVDLWPEERVLERGAAWAEVLARHRCGG
ncbi:MAG TPA: hypothetical protein VD886_09125 [Herpetosiphonaceae bacterium]|nr:hypothetical protein [Herpetosiphonaceae bacterium]